MALVPFDGELDAPPTAMRPFEGKLDAPAGLTPFAGKLDNDSSPGGAPTRNAFAYANDFMIDAANAAAGLAKAGVDLVAPGSAPSKAIGDFIESGRESQSDWKQASRAELGRNLANADGEIDKAGAYLKHAIVEDPLGTVAEVAGNIGPFGAVGRGLQGLNAATRTGAMMGLAGGLSAGEVRGNIFEKISSTPDAELQAASPEYARLRQSMGEAEAKATISGNFERHAPEILAAGAVGALGGKYGLEGMAARVAPARSRLANAAIGVLDEGTQGAAEQFASNVGVRRTLPDQALLENVALNAAAEGILGLGGAAVGPTRNDRAAQPQGEAFDVDAALAPAAPARLPSEELGLDPTAGPLSAAAAHAVDTGASPAARPAAPLTPDVGAGTDPALSSIGLQGETIAQPMTAPETATPIPEAPPSAAPQDEDAGMPAPDFGEFAPFTPQQSPVPLENAQRLAQMLEQNGRAVLVVPNIDGSGFGLAPADALTPEQQAAVMRFQPQQADALQADQTPIEDETRAAAALARTGGAADQENTAVPLEVAPAGAGIPPRFATPEAEARARRTVPYTEQTAQREAARLSNARQEAFAVVPHPMHPGRFAVVPGRALQLDTQRQPAPQAGASLAVQPAATTAPETNAPAPLGLPQNQQDANTTTTAASIAPAAPQFEVIRPDGSVFGRYFDQRDAQGAIGRAGAGATVRPMANPQALPTPATSAPEALATRTAPTPASSPDALQPGAPEQLDAPAPTLNSSGKPFASATVAARSAKHRKLDMRPVRISGGWGLLPTQAAPLPQPWELGQDDFVALAQVERDGQRWSARWNGQYLDGENEAFNHPDLGKTIVSGGRFFRTRREAELVARGAHKRAVRRALMRGEPISPEVLALYPDLGQPTAIPGSDNRFEVILPTGRRFGTYSDRRDADAALKRAGAGAAVRPMDLARPGDQAQNSPTPAAPAGDLYDQIETRPNTTEAQRAAGRSALRDLLGRLGNSLARRRNDGAGRGAVSLLGARLYEGFVAGEANQLVGQEVSGPADLAALAQVYRDPRFETFRAFFVKSGKIVGENGYTSRLPAVVRVPDNLPEQVRDDMQAFGATGYYLLHNHPSGRAEPSVQDVRLTNDVDQKAPGMLGHIVIDHNEYSVIQGSGQVQRVTAPELAAIDFKSKPTLAHNLLNVEIGGPADVVTLAKALQIPGGHATLVLTGSDGRVSLLLDLPAAMLDDASPEGLGKVKGVMRALARESGSGGHRFIVLPAGAQTNVAMGELIRFGVVSDVVTAAGDSMRMKGTPWGGNFLDGRDAKVMRISDEASPYTVAEDAPDRYARDTAGAPQAQADPGALPPAPRLTPAEWIGHALRTNRGWAMGALTRDQITDIWGDSMPGVRRFDEVVREMDTVRQRIAERADVILERWRELPSEVADRVSDLMHRATLAQFDPDAHRAGALNTEQADMLRMWKALLPEAQSLYRDVRDTYRETLLSIRDGLANRAESAGTNGARIAAQIRLEFDKYLKDGPYFPLARFGELMLIADKGKERIVETFESSAQRELRMRQLRGAGWTMKATSKAQYSATRDGAAGQFIGDVLEKINALEMPAAQKSALMDNLNQLAIGTLPDASYRRHFRHRKGVPGFSSDAMRAFAASMQHAGHHIAKIRHAQELALLLDGMQKDARDARGDVDVTEQQQVINELSRRLDYLMNPSTHPVAAAAGQVGFVMSLGGSVASGLVNLTQTPFVTLPWLGARYGFGKASTALTKAARDYFGGKWEKWSGFVMAGNPKLTGDEQRAIRELETMGLINLTQAHDLAGTANTDSTVSRRAFVIDRAMKVVGWTFHVPEVFNRQVSALAAYRLARGNGRDHAGAVEAARGALIRTHFDYSASNRARFMQGNFTRVITMFKQYSQQMTYLLWRNAYQALKGESPEVKREARRMLVGVAAMHFTAAGSLGLPLGVFGITPLLGLLSMGMGDEDDPWEWEAEYRNMLADVFGKEGGEAIARGPLRMLLNVDFASRVGLGDLWIRGPQKEAEGRDLVEAWLISLLGPVAGYAGQMGTAAKAFEEGKFSRGVEAMMPKFASAPLRAYRYNDEGVRSWRGDDLGIDLTPADIVGTALGFQPARLAEMYEGRNAVKGREAKLQDRRSEILNLWVAANMAGDREGQKEAMEAAQRFSARNPAFAIQADSFRQAYRAKMRNADQIRDGIHLSRKREELREEGRFANID